MLTFNTYWLYESHDNRVFVFLLGPLDVDAAEQYIRFKTPIDIREEGRIEIIKSSQCQKGKRGC